MFHWDEITPSNVAVVVLMAETKISTSTPGKIDLSQELWPVDAHPP